MKHYTLTAEQMQQVREALDELTSCTRPKGGMEDDFECALSQVRAALALLDAAMQAPEATAGGDVREKARKRSAWLRPNWTPKQDYTPEMASYKLVLELLDLIDALAATRTPEATAGGDVREAAVKCLASLKWLTEELGNFKGGILDVARERVKACEAALTASPTTTQGREAELEAIRKVIAALKADAQATQHHTWKSACNRYAWMLTQAITWIQSPALATPKPAPTAAADGLREAVDLKRILSTLEGAIVMANRHKDTFKCSCLGWLEYAKESAEQIRAALRAKPTAAEDGLREAVECGICGRPESYGDHDASQLPATLAHPFVPKPMLEAYRMGFITGQRRTGAYETAAIADYRDTLETWAVKVAKDLAALAAAPKPVWVCYGSGGGGGDECKDEPIHGTKPEKCQHGCVDGKVLITPARGNNYEAPCPIHGTKPEAPMDAWQPIETAPKDGSLVIVPGGVARWGGDCWLTVTGEPYPGRPIEWPVKAWQPLPTPPEESHL